MKNRNLKQQTISGFKWTFIEQIGVFGGQFVIGIVLARILSPSDFGMIGLLSIFIAVSQSLVNSGFGQALVQKKEANDIDFSTVFYFNIGISIILWALISIASPHIANFYNIPELKEITIVLCFSIIINSISFIQQVRLSKLIEFKSQSIINVVSVLIAGVIGITLAYMNFGVWALVYQTIIKSIISTILFWYFGHWKPLFKFSIHSLKGLFKYGSNILAGGLIASFFDNIYSLIIGKFFNAQNLGYYIRADQFQKIPLNIINSTVQKVTYPVFTKLQDNDQQLIKGLRQVSRMLVAITLPIMMLLMLIAKPLVLILLTEKWSQSIPYFQLMCVYGWIAVLQTINIQIITVKGRSDYYFKFQLYEKLAICFTILITFRFGIMAIIWGQLVTSLLSYLITTYYLKKVVPFKLKDQLNDILPFLISTIITVLILQIFNYFYIIQIFEIILKSLFFFLIYILLLHAFRVSELKIIRSYISNKIKRNVNDSN